MGIVALIIKVMPDSLDVNLKEIKQQCIEYLEKEGAKNILVEEQPVAFGLKALIIKMAWPEEKSTDLPEENLAKIPHVSSVSIEDYRRAFG